MNSGQIRETYLGFFEARGHRRMPSASLIPPPSDTSTLLTVAGMQPFKPYFLGIEKPPAGRLTSSQKCFRTPDIDEVGKTQRHLTCFEMLGNFSFGDYFKEEAIAFGWQLSTEGFGFDPEMIWVTVFGGDEELGLGPDQEAIDIWLELGVPRERIVELPRAENFWQGGPTGPCGPCSEMYLDRGEDLGPDALPGDDSDRFLEYWNHVFMTYDLGEDGSLKPLPKRNIDTGMGLERMAAILQDVPSVFETDLFRPLIELAEQLSGRSYEESEPVTRAMRIVADHSRGMTFLLADGVVPSNEDRGYILRRVMRRAILRGRGLGFEGPWLGRFAEKAIEMLGAAHPALEAERETVLRWVGAEEESFGRTLERGSEILDGLIGETRQRGASELAAEHVFLLHDTYGFPYELTSEIAGEQSLAIDQDGFEQLMREQRQRARRGVESGLAADAGSRADLAGFAASTDPTRFVGFERLSAETGLLAVATENGRALAKLEESPFYAEGGGQVSDTGLLRWDGGMTEVVGVRRVGDDQVLEIAPPRDGVGGAPSIEWLPEVGLLVEAEVDSEDRHATMRNHTATHLLHAALRHVLGPHVRQAGSAVRPDKLRFDFTQGEAMTAAQLRAVEDHVNQWIAAGRPVRWMNMAKDEAVKLGAMALFGEKYGDWVRVVEVENVSRELCGGTHVTNAAEVGIFRILSEGSSSSNVRRIEAITGPVAIEWFRARADELAEVGELLGSPQDAVAAAARAAARLADFESQAKAAGSEQASRRAGALVDAAKTIGEIKLIAAEVEGESNPKQLLELANRIRSAAGEAAIALAGGDGKKAGLVVLLGEAAQARGLSAAAIVRQAAPEIGGGGGGRDDMAQAGGRDPAGVERAVESAREAIERGLRS